MNTALRVSNVGEKPLLAEVFKNGKRLKKSTEHRNLRSY